MKPTKVQSGDIQLKWLQEPEKMADPEIYGNSDLKGQEVQETEEGG